MAIIHVEVSNDSPLEKVHNLINQIEKNISDKVGLSLGIHANPVVPPNANKVFN